MSLTDELERLGQLHKDGTLNDQEFELAKSKLLSQSTVSSEPDRSLGEAANRYVSFHIIMGVVGLIIALVVFGFILSHVQGDHSHFVHVP